MKKIKIASLVIVGMLCAFVRASALSAPVKAAVHGCEKAAVKLGIRTAEKPVVRGGAKLAAVTAERDAGKKILAVGAATAMVVAGHEIADGVQKNLEEKGKGERARLESLGKASEEHPEVAIAAGKSLSEDLPAALAKCLLIAGLSALVGFAFWFLWPWFRLVRNASALAARRRAAAMRFGDVIEVTPVSMGSAEPACRSGFSRLEVLFAVSACLALTILGVWRMAAGPHDADPTGGKTSAAVACAEDGNKMGQAGQDERIARRKAAIAKLHAAYAESLDSHYRNFLSDIERVGSAQFGSVRRGIPAVVAKYGTFSRCKDLFKTIVTDKLKGEDETGNSIKRDLEVDYYKGLYAARDRVQGCLEDFLRNVECARETFKLELEAELDKDELPGDDAYKALLVECGEQIEQKKDDLKWGQIDAGVAVALEAVLIRQTVAAVAKILGKTAARQAGTMAAGAGVAVADGPLPVGDIIAGVAITGCTAWSVWDVYKATKVLPEELRSTLEATTRKCERQTLEELKKAGEMVFKTYSTGATA